MSGDDESALVSRARNREIGAFESLYRRHAARVHTLCWRIAGDRAIAEDLSQESFVLAWRKLAEFRGDSSFGTWLYRIATNVALAHLRRQPHWSRHEELDAVADHIPAPAQHDSERIDLERAIAALPARARTVLVLHDLEGFDHAEIGAIMEIAVGTSKAQLHRARQILIKSMQ